MNTQPTPRTDEVASRDGNWDTKAFGMTDYARQLERELAEAREQRDTLAEALEHTVLRIQDFEKCIAGRRRNPPSVSGALAFAAQALAAVKGGSP
jgi:hypothetical protein